MQVVGCTLTLTCPVCRQFNYEFELPRMVNSPLKFLQEEISEIRQ